MVHENIWSLVWYALCKGAQRNRWLNTLNCLTDFFHIHFFFCSYMCVCISQQNPLMHQNAYGEWGIVIISKMFLMIIKRYLVWYCDHWSMKIYFQFKSDSFFSFHLRYFRLNWKIFFWFNCECRQVEASIMIFCTI